MPWDSVKQARWGHSSAGVRALGKDKVAEYDSVTPKGSLSKKKTTIGDLMRQGKKK